MRRRTSLKLCLFLFAVSFAVRIIVWQNNKIAAGEVQSGVTMAYIHDAEYLLNGDLRTFLTGTDPPSDATILLHPQGYPIMIAAVFSIVGERQFFLFIQILISSFAPLIIFLIASRLFDFRTSVIAGFLVAVGPQFAYYSAVMLPDGLAAICILAAIYAVVLARENPRLLFAILCGVAIGISCWLRANAMILPVFFAAAVVALMPRQIRFRFALTLMASFILVISPMMIRNLVVFKALIPVSLGTGYGLVYGLAQYDTGNRFDVPKTDEALAQMEAGTDVRIMPPASLRRTVSSGSGNEYDTPSGSLRTTRSGFSPTSHNAALIISGWNGCLLYLLIAMSAQQRVRYSIH